MNRTGGNGMRGDRTHGTPTRGVSRREFVKAAVAIGGGAALSACLGREKPDLPQGADDLSTLPERQHAWNDALPRDDAGNVVAPRHRVLRLFDYAGEGTPTADERETVEAALRSLERAYPRTAEGLFVTISYSPAYFERFGADPSLELPEPEVMAPFEDPAFDRPDAMVHVASNYGSVVLGAEQALVGEQSTLNGVEMDADVSDVFADADLTDGGSARRTGFIGKGLPADHQDVDGIPDSEPVPEESPLYMGFKSGFEKNQASEDSVTIDEGPFAGGTTQHLSLIRLHLQQWYEQDSRFHREATMFCPAHADEGKIEGVGENLGDSAGMDEECIENVESDAREHGVVGHSQKSARARRGDEPLMIRRDFDSTDGGQASLHFLSLQQSIADFVETREAMNGTDVADSAAVGERTNNGILQYMTVERRGNYLLPPRSRRALPTPGG